MGRSTGSQSIFETIGDMFSSDTSSLSNMQGCGNSNSDRQEEVAPTESMYDEVVDHISAANSELAKRAGSMGLMGDMKKAIAELTAANDRLKSRQAHEHLTTGQAATISFLAGVAHGYGLGNSDIASLHLSLIGSISAATSSSSDSSGGCGSSSPSQNTPIPPGGGGC